MTAHEKIDTRRIGVLGMARSGLAAALLAQRIGGHVFVSDSAPAEQLVESCRRLKKAGIRFETGGHTEQLLKSDYFVVSPGIPPGITILDKARQKGIPLFSEIEFASWACRGRIVAVTGSNGKTTTTTLLGEIFKAAGFDAAVCGNVGLPFSEVADSIPETGLAVVEVSTFQLELIDDFCPHVALILNLSADHLDRHGSFENYKKLKYRISENQSSSDFLILNKDDPTLAADNIESNATRICFSTDKRSDTEVFVDQGQLIRTVQKARQSIIKTNEILLPGPHNLQNAAAAVCAVTVFGVPAETIRQVLQSFAGVEHRMERIDSVAGVSFVNDSKATNVDAVCYALRSVKGQLYLIAGGRDKGGDFERIIEYGKNIRGIFVIGEAGDKIFDALGKTFPVRTAESMEQAVSMAFDKASPGETVLLSPGCASFDMFDNFEHRGNVFKAAVAGLRSNKSSNEIITG